MELGEIIKDAVKYPTSNIKALLLYLVLGLLIGVVEVLTGITSITKLSLNFDSGIVLGIIGVIIVIAIALLMLGFSLDVIKFAIKRSADAPEIDLARQISNGLKYIIISIVYMIIPIIIIVVLGAIFQHWIATILGLIVAIIFAFALTMAVCRLSKTDNLGSALGNSNILSAAAGALSGSGGASNLLGNAASALSGSGGGIDSSTINSVLQAVGK